MYYCKKIMTTKIQSKYHHDLPPINHTLKINSKLKTQPMHRYPAANYNFQLERHQLTVNVLLHLDHLLCLRHSCNVSNSLKFLLG